MAPLLQLVIGLTAALLLWVAPVGAILNTDSYDGNIYALYAGNGSLVPPASTLGEAMDSGRTSVVIYYLDDSAVSKRFAPVVSELQRLWGQNIELIPLTTDGLQGRPASGAKDPATYWNGSIPQVVVIGPDSRLVFDRDGQVPLSEINQAISSATGLPAPDLGDINQDGSFNEVNVEVTSN
ncbi:MAG: thylakoid membrane photosystem I accumulation factor [Synechococcus sp. BS307-5m-G36]|nr:thylakoid membrane photosystem I accumulation factor [Synechococcus sp. BS307-5m-G36]MBL6879990.1 thylakoid membrane photosystem I accumulation factor [Synechococcus sp. BS30m-G31]